MLTPEIVKELRAAQQAFLAEDAKPWEGVERSREWHRACSEWSALLTLNADALLSVAEAAQSDWIPVAERLPPCMDRYEATVERTMGQFSGRTVQEVFWESGRQEWTRDRKPLMNSEKVLAWRPLPAPYQPEQEQKS